MKTMPANDKRYVSTEEIERLVQGSYEKLSLAVQEAVDRDSARVFGYETKSKVLGTFKGLAVVASEKGDFRRVRYDVEGTTKVVLGESEQIAVTTFPASSVSDLIKSKAREAVEAILEGRTSAGSKVSGVLDLLAEASDDEAAIVGRIRTFVAADRSWRRTVRSDSASRNLQDARDIATPVAVLGEAIEKTLSTDELRGRLNVLSLEARKEADRVASARASAKLVVEKVDSSTEEGRVVRRFLRFAEDLTYDLRWLKDSSASVAGKVKSPPRLHEAHDMLAEHFLSCLRASLLVEKLSKRLCEAV